VIVLGFDPGVSCGWALVEVARPPQRPRFVRAGVIAGEAPLAQFVDLMRGVDLVAIEQTSGIAFAGKKGIVANLIDCAAVHGGIARIAESVGLPVELVRAVDWRSALLRKPNASDAEISAWCQRNVLEMPTRSSVHARDAMGAAIAGALRRFSAAQLARSVPPRTSPTG